jgi:hypothetical protein
MASPVRLNIDLDFSLSNGGSYPAVAGSVTADGTDVAVTLREDAVALTDSRAGLALARTVGAELARVGLTVALHTRNGVVGTVGAVRAPWIQRLFTRSPHIKLGSVSALLALRKAGRASNATSITLPPTTLLPILPTVQRGVRRQVTTTHYLPGSGRPRLIFAVASAKWDGRAPREFNLLPDTTVIGSSETADLVLPGLDAVHARIVHDDRDEYVLYVTGNEPPIETALLDARPNDGRILRTGALIALGSWRLAFFREEFADHGRPFGGRAGGELAVQRPQPERRKVAPPRVERSA